MAIENGITCGHARDIEAARERERMHEEYASVKCIADQSGGCPRHALIIKRDAGAAKRQVDMQPTVCSHPVGELA